MISVHGWLGEWVGGRRYCRQAPSGSILRAIQRAPDFLKSASTPGCSCLDLLRSHWPSKQRKNVSGHEAGGREISFVSASLMSLEMLLLVRCDRIVRSCRVSPSRQPEPSNRVVPGFGRVVCVEETAPRAAQRGRISSEEFLPDVRSQMSGSYKVYPEVMHHSTHRKDSPSSAEAMQLTSEQKALQRQLRADMKAKEATLNVAMGQQEAHMAAMAEIQERGSGSGAKQGVEGGEPKGNPMDVEEGGGRYIKLTLIPKSNLTNERQCRRRKIGTHQGQKAKMRSSRAGR